MASLYEKISQYKDSNITALYFENKKYSFKELISNINKMVTYLKEKGVKENDVVTVVLPNIPITIYTFYALNAIGAIQNIVHPLTPIKQIIETMKQTKSKHAIVLQTLYKENVSLLNESEYNFFFVNPMFDKSLLMRSLFYVKYSHVKKTSHLFELDKFRRCKQTIDNYNHDGLKDSIYLHSGGTTGTPKVIALSDNAINNLADKVKGIIPSGIIGKSMLAVLPSFHGFGLAMGLHAPLYNQAASALMIKFNSRKVIKWINQNKVNLIIGVPLLYQKLMKDPAFVKSSLNNLDYCFVGGDNVPVSLIQSFNKLMKENNSNAMLLEGYGLTETVTVCSVNTKENNKYSSVGKPLIGIDIKIFDDNQNELNPDEIGEVYVRCDTVMNGYLNDETTTKQTLVNIDGLTYVKTGDLGYKDVDGYLYLKGRKKRMFKISGMNVYPFEIEKIVTNLNCVFDAALEYFETPKPHLVLYVIKNNKIDMDESAIKEEILNNLNEKVLKYSMPSNIVFMDEFCKTNVGKIDHKAFKDVN